MLTVVSHRAASPSPLEQVISVHEFDIRYQVARFLIDEVSVEDLRSWLLDGVNLTEEGSPEERLMAEVSHLLGEFSDGRVGEEALRARLLELTTG